MYIFMHTHCKCTYVYIKMNLSIYLSVCLSVCLPVCLSVCLSVSPSIHPPIYLPILSYLSYLSYPILSYLIYLSTMKTEYIEYEYRINNFGLKKHLPESPQKPIHRIFLAIPFDPGKEFFSGLSTWDANLRWKAKHIPG